MNLFEFDNFENNIGNGNYIKSPLNYTGGKYRLLPQIIPLFPKKIDTFVDLFCGGCDVGINVKSNYTLFNDINKKIIGLFHTFKNYNKNDIFQSIDDIIDEFNFSKSNIYGYNYYNCHTNKGLAVYNNNSYMKLREYFNSLKNINYEYYIIFYVLIIFSFNNQIRFNNQNEFNVSVGKRDFNNSMRKNLSKFIDTLQTLNCGFTSTDFNNLNFSSELNENDLVYADPPYLITTATYNLGWSENSELNLYNYLDNLDNHNIRFALSNVIKHKSKTNDILQQWLDDNPQYICHHLNYNYSNCNYHTIDKSYSSDEVLIVNY